MNGAAIQTQVRTVNYVSSAPFSSLPVWKRVLDLTLVVLLAPALILISLVVAVIIKLGSPGPLLFCQERIGHRGRPFRIFKFRTMHYGAETKTHQDYVKHLIASGKPMAKLDGARDPRLIPLATVLRATGIDELPQIINIIKGEMSFVGPRPCVRYEYEGYEPHHHARLNAIPGLTGLWQVSGKNRTTFEQMVAYDVRYSREFSLKMDLWIIAKTFGALAGQCKDQIERRRAAKANSDATEVSRMESCKFQKS